MAPPKYFVAGLEPRLWKLIPLREQYDRGESVYLYEYAGSLVKDLMGGLETYPVLSQSAYYISVVNTVQFLSKYNTPYKEWRSEIFKVLNLIKKVLAEVSVKEEVSLCPDGTTIPPD